MTITLYFRLATHVLISQILIIESSPPLTKNFDVPLNATLDCSHCNKWIIQLVTLVISNSWTRSQILNNNLNNNSAYNQTVTAESGLKLKSFLWGSQKEIRKFQMFIWSLPQRVKIRNRNAHINFKYIYIYIWNNKIFRSNNCFKKKIWQL